MLSEFSLEAVIQGEANSPPEQLTGYKIIYTRLFGSIHIILEKNPTFVELKVKDAHDIL